jgi:hypothetical protein
MKDDEALLNLRDILTGKTVLAHGGSVAWNGYRRRWVMIAVETFGSSFLGEVWYAEADTPIGPWVYARKIVTHDDYSFYNPRHHPMFDQENGRIIYFEATYTSTFSGNKDPTPRYDYNQIMYQLDLGDLRLALPVPVYSSSAPDVPARLTTRSGGTDDQRSREVAFFAPDRAGIATVPVIERRNEHGGWELVAGGGGTAVFYVVPVSQAPSLPGAIPLYEFRNGKKPENSPYYSVVEEPRTGYRRSSSPLGMVWRNPSRMRIW